MKKRGLFNSVVDLKIEVVPAQEMTVDVSNYQSIGGANFPPIPPDANPGMSLEECRQLANSDGLIEYQDQFSGQSRLFTMEEIQKVAEQSAVNRVVFMVTMRLPEFADDHDGSRLGKALNEAMDRSGLVSRLGPGRKEH
jgi:hypothetical protein